MNRNIDTGIRRSWWYEVYWPQYVGGAELSSPLSPRETFSLNPFLCCSSGYCCCQHLTSVDTEPAWSSSPDCSLQKIESFHSQSVIKLVLELAFWLSEVLLARRGEESETVQVLINHLKSLPAVRPLIGRQALSSPLIGWEPGTSHSIGRQDRERDCSRAGAPGGLSWSWREGETRIKTTNITQTLLWNKNIWLTFSNLSKQLWCDCEYSILIYIIDINYKTKPWAVERPHNINQRRGENGWRMRAEQLQYRRPSHQFQSNSLIMIFSSRPPRTRFFLCFHLRRRRAVT